VHAEEAHRIGLVNQVHPREERLTAAKATAATMGSKNRFGLRMTQDAFNTAPNGSSLEEANRMEDRKGGAHHRQRHNGGREGPGVTTFQTGQYNQHMVIY
jgi:enoyl-CoA hydratase/carnithine racemase